MDGIYLGCYLWPIKSHKKFKAMIFEICILNAVIELLKQNADLFHAKVIEVTKNKDREGRDHCTSMVKIEAEASCVIWELGRMQEVCKAAIARHSKA